MVTRTGASQRPIRVVFLSLITLLMLTGTVRASNVPEKTSNPKQPKSLLAYVFDDRFSVVRSRPDAESGFLRRLRPGHRIFIAINSPDLGRAKFRRVTVSRNLSGWILAAAIAAPGVPGDDQKLFRYAESQPRDKGILALRILTTHFTRSRLRAAALLRLGQLAEEEARQLSIRANRKLTREELALPDGLEEMDLFANYRGLDHFAAQGIRFAYLAEKDHFVYNGDAYKEIVRRFPESAEAVTAREKLVELRGKIRE